MLFLLVNHFDHSFYDVVMNVIYLFLMFICEKIRILMNKNILKNSTFSNEMSSC